MSSGSGARAELFRAKPAAVREAYLALMAQGMTSVAAARAVGIHRRTGIRWRRENPVPAEVGQAVFRGPAAHRRAISARFLSPDERIVIADRLREGASMRTIAAELGRSPSTVSREVARNAHPGSGVYRPWAAQGRAEGRRPRPKARKIASCEELAERIQEMLNSRCSPEQIARRLRRDHPDRSELHVTHETIYQALYVQGRGGLRRELTTALRTGRAVRRPRRRADERRTRLRTPLLMISERPAEVEDRAVPGHWEGDLIIGKDNASAIATLVERHTRYVLLAHLGRGRTAEHVRDALLSAMATLPAHLKRSLTWDQGLEMALHHDFTAASDMQVYFCDPHSPWQRGSNENTNGLLRQYFPKSTDLAVHTPEHLATVAAELNARPRKTLDWDTPAERLATLLNTPT